jgi:hypothetical protein
MGLPGRYVVPFITSASVAVASAVGDVAGAIVALAVGLGSAIGVVAVMTLGVAVGCKGCSVRASSAHRTVKIRSRSIELSRCAVDLPPSRSNGNVSHSATQAALNRSKADVH